MATIDMLLQGASTDEDKLRMQADALRGKRRAAQAFSLSTIPEVSSLAQQEGKDIMSAAKQGGALRQAAQRAAEQKRQYDLTRADRQKQHEENLALKKSLAEMKAKGGGAKPAASLIKTYNEARRLSGVIDELGKRRGAFSEEELGELDQPYKEAVASYLPDAFQRIAEEQMYDSDSVRSYKTRLSRLESRLSQLASGLAVTGFEMSDRQKWSPNAPGITDAERQRRLNNIRRDLLGEQKVFEETFPGFKVGEADYGEIDIETSIAPSGVDQSEWDSLSAEDKDFYLENF